MWPDPDSIEWTLVAWLGVAACAGAVIATAIAWWPYLRLTRRP